MDEWMHGCMHGCMDGCIDGEHGEYGEHGEHGGADPIRLREEESTVVPKKLLDPRLPSQDEVDRHNLTHLPYRNWCPICIQARGKEMDHMGMADKERRYPE